MLETLINEYVAIQKKEEELKVEKAHLANTIMREMTTSSVTCNGYVASKCKRENIKYNNEKELISILKANNLDAYIIEKIDATPLNKAIKLGKYQNLVEGMYTTSTTDVLTVKPVLVPQVTEN